MKLKTVRGYGLMLRCVRCGHTMDTRIELVWADIEGRAFVDYYCNRCIKELEVKTNDDKETD